MIEFEIIKQFLKMIDENLNEFFSYVHANIKEDTKIKKI